MSSDSQARCSLVIPCFNDGLFVPGAIASVREDEPVEILVVDDGSTDAATLAVLDDLRGQGIRVIRQDNAGLAAARMRGVAETSAPFVLCLDADDELAPGALGALADAIEANPDAAFALGSLELFGARSEVRSFPPWDPWRLLYANHWTAHGLYRREELTAVGGWTLADCYEDWDLLLALAERGCSPVILRRVAVRYRQHETARMNSRCRQRHGEVYAILRSRHPALYGRRRELARRSSARLWQRIAFPLILGSRRLYPPVINRQVDRLRPARLRN
jgi:glycosyltransferase involved in cell wall biosynthesis